MCVLPARLSTALLHITIKKGLSSDPVFEADAVVTHLVILSRIVCRLKRENKKAEMARGVTPRQARYEKSNPMQNGC